MSDRQQLTDRWLRCLARREHSQQELVQKSKGFPVAVVDALLEDFIIKGWQSDQRYAESIVRVRYRAGKGPLYIQQELKRQGLSSECIAQALDQYSHQQWVQRCIDVHVGKHTQPAKNIKEKAKQHQFLLQRGFDHKVINHVLSSSSSTLEDEMY